MQGGLYRVKRPITIQGVDHKAGALVRMSAALARDPDLCDALESVPTPQQPRVLETPPDVPVASPATPPTADVVKE